MEGYFPVTQYCQLTGVSKDTAHHRAIRGTVESFKNKHGRWFLYFSDENKPIPEGYIHIDDYARMHHKDPRSVRALIRKNRFQEGDIYYHCWMTKYGAHMKSPYVREAAEYPNDQRYDITQRNREVMNKYRPEGYLTVPEFSEGEECQACYVYNRINVGKIRSAKCVGGHWYVPETLTIEEVYTYGHKIRGERSKG